MSEDSAPVPVERLPVEGVPTRTAVTAESPLWSVEEQALYWIDIESGTLHRLARESAGHRVWALGEDLGAFTLYRDGKHALLALRSGLKRLTLASGALELLAAAPFDPRLYRFNEGACDARGRFWVGTLFDPHRPADEVGAAARRGPWYSFTEAEGLEPHPDFAEVPNGLAWDPSGHTLYLAHSKEKLIFAFDFDAEAGRFDERRVFAQIPAALGVPDGCAIDESGGYWCALNGAGRLRRFHRGGQADRDVLLPVSRPTMCAFAGADLETLYVTSQTRGLSPEQRAREPLSGQLIRLRPGVRGRAPALFGG